MLARNRLAALLVAALAAGAVLALTLTSAAAGPAGGISRLYLPVMLVEATATPQPSPTPTDTPVPTATQQQPGCDYSYPTICVPYPPPDLDCGDIPDRNFQVVPPDDHHFDSDHDGIGCESA